VIYAIILSESVADFTIALKTVRWRCKLRYVLQFTVASASCGPHCDSTASCLHLWCSGVKTSKWPYI